MGPSSIVAYRTSSRALKKFRCATEEGGVQCNTCTRRPPTKWLCTFRAVESESIVLRWTWTIIQDWSSATKVRPSSSKSIKSLSLAGLFHLSRGVACTEAWTDCTPSVCLSVPVCIVRKEKKRRKRKKIDTCVLWFVLTFVFYSTYQLVYRLLLSLNEYQKILLSTKRDKIRTTIVTQSPLWNEFYVM